MTQKRLIEAVHYLKLESEPLSVALRIYMVNFYRKKCDQPQSLKNGSFQETGSG